MTPAPCVTGPGSAALRALARGGFLCLALVVGAPAPAAPQPTDPEPAWYLRAAGGGCELFVQEYGPPAPDTVVVLHGGWGAEHSYLLRAFEGAAEGRHLVFYDQRGSLRSPCPDSALSLEAHLADLDRLRRELGLDRMTLFAHSMGTRLALFYLRRHPRRVGGLVLAGASPLSVPRTEEARALAEKQEAAKRRLGQRKACRREISEEGLDRPDSLLTDEERSARWRIRFACSSVHRVDRWRRVEGGRAFYDASAGAAVIPSIPRDSSAFDFRREVGRHPCPVRVLVGDRDFGPYAGELHRRLSASIEGVELRVLENAAHLPWVDRPRAWRRALGRALDGAAGCGAGGRS